MSADSKLLKVSYGTFSCTLEGFDDPFEVMKSVAEYFRELAANDREFGATQMQPDPEILARIATQGTQQPVAGEMEGDHLTLRPGVDMPETQVEDGTPGEESAHEVEIAEEAEAGTPQRQEAEQETPELLSDAADDQEPKAEEPDTTPESDEEDADAAAETPEPGGQPEPAAQLEASEPDDTGDVLPDESTTAEAETQAEAETLAPKEHPAASIEAAPPAEVAKMDAPTPEPEPKIADEAKPTPLADKLREIARATSAPGDDTTFAEDLDEAQVARPTPGPQKTRARVIKMKKSEFGALVASGTLEEVAEDGTVVAASARANASTVSSLSDAEEAELQRELAEAARFVPDPDAMPALDAEIISAAAAAAQVQGIGRRRAARRDSQALGPKPSEFVDKIFDKAEQKLDEPENRANRDAYRNLKAAVAATEAAKQLGDTVDGSTDVESGYKEVLASVVRPTQATAAHPKKPPAVAPLHLVPAQRVDVASANESQELGQPDDGFASFAERQGAVELGDLLEAAAAYATAVEGHQTFTRPQVMARAMRLSGQAHSREDGLRGFGTLIREGRIEKAGAGYFKITDNTRFVEERAAS
ncbi:MAG: hypothetical protein AAF330_03745 [Pseudomonadota bacterium]